MEYLKNLVLQLYTTGEAEALLPVFAALLAFGPLDMQRCKQVRALLLLLLLLDSALFPVAVRDICCHYRLFVVCVPAAACGGLRM
jgi:hypothetical protein